MLGYKRKDLMTFFILHFIVCELAFMALFTIIFIYHGPFIKLREIIVSTAMATSKNKWFATAFLSSDEINKILLRTNPVVKNGIEDLNGIKIPKHSKINTLIENKSSNGIKILDVKGQNFKGKLIIVTNPKRITLGLAPKLGKIGATLSEIIKTSGAVGGINAGGFQDDNLIGTGANPDGIVVLNGKIKFKQESNKYFNIIGFNYNNVLFVSNKMTIADINKSNLQCAISFGPTIITNGQPLVAYGGVTLQPRSAIAQRKDGSILLLAIDGRQSYSAGATFQDEQNILLQYGAYNAANLDGGSSTTISYQGKTLNNPCDITGERSIASAFLIMP